MAKFRVWVADNAFLYLPLYALADLGILKRVGSALNRSNVEIEIHAVTPRGDKNCIEKMLAEATNDDEIVNIAIADPIAAFSIKDAAERVRVIGALIKGCSFWLLGRDQPRPSTQIDQQQRVVCYNPSLATGYFLGERLKEELGTTKDAEYVKLGEEIDLLLDPQKSEEFVGELQVLTVDVIGAVRAMRADSSIRVVRSYADRNVQPQYSDFVTTGIMVHASDANSKAKADLLAIFIEAVRTASALLHTAEGPLAALAERLSRKAEFRDQIRVLPSDNGTPPLQLTEDEAAALAKLIIKDGLYNGSVAIRHEEWATSVKARQWRDDKQQREAIKLFDRIYDGRATRRRTADWLRSSMRDYFEAFAQAEQWKVYLTAMLGALLMIQAGTIIWANVERVPEQVTRMYTLASAIALALGIYWSVWPALRDYAWRFRPFVWFAGADSASDRAKLAEHIVTAGSAVAVFLIAAPRSEPGMSSQELWVSLTILLVPAALLSWRLLRRSRV